MRTIFFLLALLPGCVGTGAPGGLAAMLAGRTMEYVVAPGELPDRQSWNADGTTVFHTWGIARYPRRGFWQVTGTRYCSDFPDEGQPPDFRECYRVRVIDDGRGLDFDPIEPPFTLISFRRGWRGYFRP